MRKFTITVTGSAIILAGIAMLVLPGPGWLTIAGGLAVLRKEYAWAGAILDYGTGKARRAWYWLGTNVHYI